MSIGLDRQNLHFDSGPPIAPGSDPSATSLQMPVAESCNLFATLK